MSNEPFKPWSKSLIDDVEGISGINKYAKMAMNDILRLCSLDMNVYHLTLVIGVNALVHAVDDKQKYDAFFERLTKLYAHLQNDLARVSTVQ